MVCWAAVCCCLTGNHVDLCGFTGCDHQIPPATTVTLLSQAISEPTSHHLSAHRPSTPNCRRQDPPGVEFDDLKFELDSSLQMFEV